MDTATRLHEAHAWAQRRFHEMLEAGVYGDPNAPETLDYIEAERRVDDMLRDAQWEQARDGLDLALGDHFVYPVAAR